MHDPDDKPLDPAAERVMGKLRRLLLISGLVMGLGFATVFGVIGYRIMRADGSAAIEATARLPRDARIIATSTAADRIVVTVEANGATEIHLFDAKTLKPAGTLRFAAEP